MTSENRTKHRLAILVADINFYAALINLHTELAVFVNVSGHVGKIEVRVAPGKEKGYNETLTHDEVYFEPKSFISGAEEALTNIKLGLKKILLDNKVDRIGLDYEEYVTETRHRDYYLAGGWRP